MKDYNLYKCDLLVEFMEGVCMCFFVGFVEDLC